MVRLNKIYSEIAERTGGDIYIGVVGPVRTGKSTFIKRFMDTLVIPNITNVYKRERAKDELPQSGSGKTIMTAEPKFVPEEAAELELDNNAKMRVRLVDCVGYMVEGALGQLEGDEPRMVTTPWFDREIPMKEAAEFGTRKVIGEHSTVGLVITTDGSITDIAREAYIEPEERVISELKELSKPFIVLVNSTEPNGEKAQRIKDDLETRFEVTCRTVNCQQLSESEITDIIKSILYEFPVKELGIVLPPWTGGLDADHPIKENIFSGVLDAMRGIRRIREIPEMVNSLAGGTYICGTELKSIKLGEGCAVASLDMPQELFYGMIEEESGIRINDEGELIPILKELGAIKNEYKRIEAALDQVNAIGYGIVMPTMNEMTLEEPELIRQGGRYGIKLKASAPSIHMMRADIQTEVSPIVGSERQSEELMDYLLGEFEGDAGKIWESNIFGKSLHELVSEGLNTKLSKMPDDARLKLRETLERIINEGSGGLICIIL